MFKTNRRWFLCGAAAIVPASSLMPGHSLASVLAPTPRSVIMQNLETIERELTALKWPSRWDPLPETSSDIIHQALGNIAMVGVTRITTPSQADVTRYWRSNDHRTIPLDVLPVSALKTVLGAHKAPIQTNHPRMGNSWSHFVQKYADTLPRL